MEIKFSNIGALATKAKIIAIVGLPATGKTTLAKELAEMLPGHKLIHTDDYIEHGYEDSINVLMGDIYQVPKLIVEGVLVYRLLNRGLTDKYFNADHVFHCVSSTEARAQRYRDTRTKALNTTMDHILRGQWRDYIRMYDDSKTLMTEYLT
jgi:deoxyadenosine/deoxycytidine kinase